MVAVNQILSRDRRPDSGSTTQWDASGSGSSAFGLIRIHDVVWVATLTLLGFAIRATGLGWESIWYDEACSLKMASHSFKALFTGECLDVGNPCGYFIALRAWCLAFGFTIESARMFSAVTDVGSIVMTWMFATAVSKDRRVAVTATLLVAINPALIFLAREARCFGLLSTIVTALAYLTERVLRDGRKRDWIGLAACCVVLPHLHYYTFFVLGSLWIPLVFGRRDGRKRRAIGYLVMGVISAAIFLPWTPNFLIQLNTWSAPYNPWMKHAAYFPVFTVAGRTLIWKQDGLLMMLFAQVVVVGGIYLPVVVSIARAGWGAVSAIRVPLGLVCGVMAFAMVLSVTYGSLLNCRYLSPIIPSILVAWSLVIWNLTSGNGLFRNVAITLACVIACASLGRMYVQPHKHDWRGVAKMVAERDENLPVVFYEDIGTESFQYYRPNHRIMPLIDRFGDSGVAWDKAGYAERLAQEGDFWFCLWTLDDWEAIETWMEERFERVDAADFDEIQLRRYQVRPAAGVLDGGPDPTEKE